MSTPAFPFEKQEALLFGAVRKTGYDVDHSILSYHKMAKVGDHISVQAAPNPLTEKESPGPIHAICVRRNPLTAEFMYIRFDGRRTRTLVEETLDQFVQRNGKVLYYPYTHEDHITQQTAALFAQRLYLWVKEGRYHVENLQDPTGERFIEYVKTGQIATVRYGNWFDDKKWYRGNIDYLVDEEEIKLMLKRKHGFLRAHLIPATHSDDDPEDKTIILRIDIATKEDLQNGSWPTKILDKYPVIYSIGGTHQDYP